MYDRSGVGLACCGGGVVSCCRRRHTLTAAAPPMRVPHMRGRVHGSALPRAFRLALGGPGSFMGSFAVHIGRSALARVCPSCFVWLCPICNFVSVRA